MNKLTQKSKKILLLFDFFYEKRRKSMKKRVINLVMVMVLLIGLVGASTGCGASDQTTWEKIQSEGKFTFACSGGYPPFNYTNDQGDLIGFDVEIAQALGDVMGVEAEGITTEWDGILGGLTGLRFDTVIGSMAITDDRLEQVSFTDPYYYDGAQFFSVEANGYTGLDDPKVTTVGLERTI
jgi:polar amino acid transport system substrate-binding protein